MWKCDGTLITTAMARLLTDGASVDLAALLVDGGGGAMSR